MFLYNEKCWECGGSYEDWWKNFLAKLNGVLKQMYTNQKDVVSEIEQPNHHQISKTNLTRHS